MWKLGNVVMQEDMQEGRLRFHAQTPCGELHHDVAVILEPGSLNPGLQITNTALGVSAVQRALILLERWREHVGLEPSHAVNCFTEPVVAVV